MKARVSANLTEQQRHTYRALVQHPGVWWGCAIVILLLGFLIRAHTLAARSLWFDEAMEYWVASAPLETLVNTVRSGIQDPPLYSLLLHFWMKLGHDEFWLRFLSLTLSMLGLAGVMLLSRHLLDKPASLIAGLLMALSPPDIRFAQEAGQYALMICLTTWSLILLRAALLRGTWRSWLLWSAAAALGMYSHYGTAIIVFASAFLALVFGFVEKRQSALVRQVTAMLLVGLLIMPLPFDLLPAQLFRGPTSQAFNISLGTAEMEIEQFLTLSQHLLLYQAMGERFAPWPWMAIPQWIVWLPIVIALVASIGRPRSALHPFTLLAVSWSLYYLIARTGAYPFGHRYSVFLTPLLAIALAAGMRRVWRMQPILGTMLLGSVLVVCVMAPSEGQENLRDVSAFWSRLRRPGDLTYVYYGAVPGFRYQLSLADSQLNQVPPLWYTHCWGGQPESYCTGHDIIYGRWIRRLVPEEKRADILTAVGPAVDRLWLIASHISADEDLQIIETLQPEYAVSASYEAENAAAYLLERH